MNYFKRTPIRYRTILITAGVLATLFLFQAYMHHYVYADLKNMGDGRWGGAITAAKFLEEFVGERPWVHIDIAGPAFYDSPKPFQDAGGTGCMIRSLVTLVEKL